MVAVLVTFVTVAVTVAIAGVVKRVFVVDDDWAGPQTLGRAAQVAARGRWSLCHITMCTPDVDGSTSAYSTHLIFVFAS